MEICASLHIFDGKIKKKKRLSYHQKIMVTLKSGHCFFFSSEKKN